MALKSKKRYVSLLIMVLVMLTLFMPDGAQAARFSGKYLRQMCSVDENGKETVKGGHAACQAYISGVIDYHNILRSLRMAPRVDICVPESAKPSDLHKAVLTFLMKDRTHDGFVAAPAVTMALREKYPCR